MFTRACIFAAGLSLFSTHAVASLEPIAIPFIGQAANIDGQMTEAHWQDAKKISIDNITWPFENKAADVKTHAYVYEDGETLFVAFIAEDPNPADIRAFYRDRDRAWNDDLVSVKIDAYNAKRMAYQFFVNPFGVQIDSIENELTKRESDAWDGIWESKGQITETGYVVEVAIPFRILNFNDAPGEKTMAMEFMRFLPRNERLRISNLKIDHNNHCWICQMQPVTGFSQAKQGKNFAITPSLVVGRSESRDVTDPNSDWQGSNDVEPGLDVKWGITPDVTLNATLNPDFSQVEADVAQLSINDNFTLFFPEKRAFFLDNADYFSSPYNLVYTRNVAEPEVGVKLTGTEGKHTFAAFIANDKQTNVLVPGNLGSSIATIDDKSENAAFRYRFDVNNDLSLAAISTLRRSGDYHNAVFGFDAKYRLTDSDTIVAQWIGSNTEYDQRFVDEFCNGSSCDTSTEPTCSEDDCPYSEALLRVRDTDELTGQGYRLSYDHNEKNWSGFANYQARSKDFRADLGFMSQVDFNKFTTGGEYRWYGDDSTWWNRARIYSDWDISHNDQGELLEKEVEARASMNGPLQSFMQLSVMGRDRVGLRFDDSTLAIDGNTDLFSENEVALYAEMKPLSGVFTGIRLSKGNAIDYSNNRIGDRISIRPQINMHLNQHLELKLRHTYSTLEADGAEVFTANLSDARLTYQFDVRSFLRLAMIYTDIERNPDNYNSAVDKQYKGFSTQLLYAYKLNPKTVFFAGYSDNGYQDDELDRIERDNRSLFIKLSYAWLM